MSKMFGWRLLTVAVVIALGWFVAEGPEVFALDGYDAMPGGPLATTAYTQAGGWYIEEYYMDLDSCWDDSAYSMVDTLYTGWVYVGKNWEAFWFQFDWVKWDSAGSLDSLDTLESVVVQGCLDPDNYPTTHDYCTAVANKADTGTWRWYQPPDSLTYNPPLPYLRAQIIFEVTTQFDDWCPILDTITTIGADHDQEEFEIRWKMLDIY